MKRVLGRVGRFDEDGRSLAGVTIGGKRDSGVVTTTTGATTFDTTMNNFMY